MWLSFLYRWDDLLILILYFFFFNDTATTEIYTLSLHDALPIDVLEMQGDGYHLTEVKSSSSLKEEHIPDVRSEEHTSELQSRPHLVCRLLLEKKKQNRIPRTILKKKKKLIVIKK